MVIKQVEFITLKSKDTWYMQKKKKTQENYLNAPFCKIILINNLHSINEFFPYTSTVHVCINPVTIHLKLETISTLTRLSSQHQEI